MVAKNRTEPAEEETKPLVFVAAGGGTVSKAAVNDLLDNWVGEREFRAYLPADRKATSEAVIHVADWLLDVDEAYTALVGATPGRKGKGIGDDAEDHLDADDIVDKIVEVLAEAKKRGDEAVLLLAWGEDPENAPDELTGWLLDCALEAGIKVLDLTMGLEDLGYVDESADPPAEEDTEEGPAAPEPTVTGELHDEEVELPDERAEVVRMVPAPDEAQAGERPTWVATIEERERTYALDEELPNLVTTLGFVYELLSNQDRANAARQLSQVRYGPLTRAVKHQLNQLIRPQVDEAVEEIKSDAGGRATRQGLANAKIARTRGRPRDTASDNVAVFHDPAKGTVRLVEGRGRPKKGETREEMSRAAYEDLSASYESHPSGS